MFEGGDEIEDLYRSINPVVRDAIAYATATVVELEDWMIDVSGNGLEAFGAFIAGEEGGIPMPHYGQTPEEQLEKNQPAMAWAKTRIDGFNNKESDRT